MPDIDHAILRSMHDEIVKTAFLGSLVRSGAGAVARAGERALANKGVQAVGRRLAQSTGDVGAGAGIGGATGALVGAGTEGYRGYKEEGVGGALSQGMRGGMTGAGVGAALGGAAGLASGGRATTSELGQTLLGGKYNPLGAAARTGQRQLHGVTGLVPGGASRGTREYSEALRGMKIQGWDDAVGAKGALKSQRKAERTFGAAKRKSKVLSRDLERAVKSGDPKAIQRAERALEQNSRAIRKGEQAVGKTTGAADRAADVAQTTEDAYQTGMTSLPGLVGAVKEKGVGALWEHGVKPQWQRGLQGKATVLAPAALAAPTLTMEMDEEGRGRGERFSRALVEGAAYTAMPMIPMAGQDLLARGAGSAAGLGGKGLDKLIGAVSSQRQKQTQLGESPGVPATDGDAEGGIPVERIMSPAAQGKPPEDLMV